MKGFLIALQFLTRLPGPRLTVSDQEFARSILWFPAVGLVVGLFVAGAAVAGARIDAWTGALAALVAWVAVTGALHLDGLGDVADAMGAAHKDRTRVLAVLADPHVGSFGVTAIAVQLLAKLVLLHGLVEQGLILPLLLIPFAARIGPLAWTLWLEPLHQGLGARFREAVAARHLAEWSAILLAACWLVPALGAAFPLALLWLWWIRISLGGISGDGHGAGIEMMETGLLLATLVWMVIR